MKRDYCDDKFQINRGDYVRYKVETYKVNEAESKMNILAQQDWRVIAVSPNVAMGFGIVVTYEKATK